ncbi:PREDICTED: probable elongator complex protein 2 [Habropoda laboriosa]|uniref:probable elongator complex protein 2 n=1 Tax=Habropoda laboriosa TaxID=597456 RepID=UPI00083DC3D6|nr:PREDICTED: probable elongator complex protein 2 [Habropoda laboriosa]
MTATYVSCACNRVPHSVDWGNNGLVCFAVCHAVAIYDPFISKIGKVTNTLHRHRERINTVRWIKRTQSKAESELLSSSVDGTAIIWSKLNEYFECSSVIEVGDILTFSNSLYLTDDDLQNDEIFSKLLICTGSIKGDLQIWLRNTSGDIKCLQTLTFGEKLPIEACFSFLPNTNLPLLAVAIENSTIELYVINSNVIKLHFTRVQILVGHEDWVRCMDFNCDTDNSLLLASGSQDAMIRLWKICANDTKFSSNELHQKEQVFIVDSIKYNVTLESVLYGHESWIYGIHWYPLQLNNKNRILRLLSCSLDKSMIIWEPDEITGIWSEKVRVGEVGGNLMGFYGCKFSYNGLNILAHGYQGSFHIWEYSNTAKNWIPKSVPSGHFAEVVDLCWDPNGRFLITASTDQTTRIHAPWKNGTTEFWHEIGRPQVHGYNISCLVMLTPYMFASGAEEKVVRIFTAPTTFKNCLKKIANVDDFKNMVADSAAVPALGLTNKATFNDNKIEVDSFKNEDYIPPTEEELMQHTLWPELQKLYGHGYEIFSITARHDGLLLATACKSASREHSAILLWNTNTWTQVQKLTSHQLTVTQMEFSPNDKYLVSVSRDRRWSLFECKDNVYTLIATSKKDSLHTRIIWCCSWTHDSSFFATGSRDGKIGIWNPNFTADNIVPTTSLDVKHSVTALVFSLQNISEHSYVLAIGFERGYIEIQKLSVFTNNCEWERHVVYDSSKAHHLTVKRLKFRPQNEYSNILQLASCGCDHIVKVYDIDILKLRDL